MVNKRKFHDTMQVRYPEFKVDGCDYFIIYFHEIYYLASTIIQVCRYSSIQVSFYSSDRKDEIYRE